MYVACDYTESDLVDDVRHGPLLDINYDPYGNELSGIAWRSDLQQWENIYLINGRYCKINDTYKYGFPYKYGDYIPVNERYSAMCAHSWALKCI